MVDFLKKMIARRFNNIRGAAASAADHVASGVWGWQNGEEEEASAAGEENTHTHTHGGDIPDQTHQLSSTSRK